MEFPAFGGQPLTFAEEGGHVHEVEYGACPRNLRLHQVQQEHVRHTQKVSHARRRAKRVLRVLLQPLSDRAQEDARLHRLIRALRTASQRIYGAPRVFLDLREAWETCSKHCVARLMRQAKLRPFTAIACGGEALPPPRPTGRTRAWARDWPRDDAPHGVTARAHA
jgi:hypothetical protein